MTDMMKAVIVNAYGEPDVLQLADVPKPTINADQVLLRAHAAGINPVDWKTRRGRGMARRYGESFPLIIGWDVSGEVVEVGANVSEFNVGDAVYGMVGFPERGNAYAEYVAAAPAHITHKPKNLTHIEASVVPLVTLTAWQALFETAQLAAGQRVLIHAASGGVGHIAVQLAKWKGATVIGTASGRNADFLQAIGVDEHIDYTTTAFDEVLHDLDVVFATMGHGLPAKSVKTLGPDGFLVCIERSGNDLDKDIPAGVNWKWFLVETNRDQLERITGLIEAGHVTPTVSHVFPLAQLADAHRQSESGRTRGKIAIQIAADA